MFVMYKNSFVHTMKNHCHSRNLFETEGLVKKLTFYYIFLYLITIKPTNRDSRVRDKADCLL